MKGVANGLSKITNLCKFKPSLGISALKKSVLESLARQKYDDLLNLANVASCILYFLGVLDHCISGSDFWSAKSWAQIFKLGSQCLEFTIRHPL